jgi:hypothetical protein
MSKDVDVIIGARQPYQLTHGQIDRMHGAEELENANKTCHLLQN